MPETNTIISPPVHTPTGEELGARGDAAIVRQRLVAGLNAHPAESASPQHPPPQSTISCPVQRANPAPSTPAGGAGSRRQRWVDGLKAWKSNGPSTSISRPVHTAW